jgi:NAD(P)-dependent dehydrogenase (short-subunit alcohol dehydrogenase family)
MKGRTALVIGGTTGIGRAAATAFGAAGANVFIVGLGSAEGKDVEAEVQSTGVEAMFVEADVTRESEVKAVVARAAERFGTTLASRGALGPFRTSRKPNSTASSA